jgi:hypothetical protein
MLLLVVRLLMMVVRGHLAVVVRQLGLVGSASGVCCWRS